MLADSNPFDDEDEGEAFDFDDSGDDVPQAPPAPEVLIDEDQSKHGSAASHPEGYPSILEPPAPFSNTTAAAAAAADPTATTSKPCSPGGATTEAEWTSVPEGSNDREADLPPPPTPPPPLGYDLQTDPKSTG